MKTVKIEIRLTPEEKEKLRKYAESQHLTMSELIRWRCEDILKGEEK